MALQVEMSEGYHLFLADGDSVNRALTDLLQQVKAAEADFIVEPGSMNWKGGENRQQKDTIHATQVVMLRRRPREEPPVVSSASGHVVTQPGTTIKKAKK